LQHEQNQRSSNIRPKSGESNSVTKSTTSNRSGVKSVSSRSRPQSKKSTRSEGIHSRKSNDIPLETQEEIDIDNDTAIDSVETEVLRYGDVQEVVPTLTPANASNMLSKNESDTSKIASDVKSTTSSTEKTMSVAEKRRRRAMAAAAGHPVTELDSVVSSENGSGKSSGKSRETERTSNVNAAAGDGGGRQSKSQSKVQAERGKLKGKKQDDPKLVLYDSEEAEEETEDEREDKAIKKKEKKKKELLQKIAYWRGMSIFPFVVTLFSCDIIPTCPNIITFSKFVLVLFDP